ncbi:MAG: hypothetical protein NT168_03990 [Planctomycetota bacterium]|jgi:hypothetical protein|nr:hypothetical protein [Planctomycetota bacterium]
MPGEWLDNEDEIVFVLQRLENTGLDEDEKTLADFKGISHSAYLIDQLYYWRRKLQWLRDRKSLPRCLTCGSDKVMSLIAPAYELPLQSFQHPNCGGTFRTAEDFHGMQTLNEVIDSEGFIVAGG